MSYFRYSVIFSDGYFIVDVDRPSGWFHIVLNFIGLDDGQEIRIYHDGVNVANDMSITISTSMRPETDRRIVLGRLYTDSNENYATVQVDDLVFFNRALTEAEITVFSQ